MDGHPGELDVVVNQGDEPLISVVTFASVEAVQTLIRLEWSYRNAGIKQTKNVIDAYKYLLATQNFRLSAYLCESADFFVPDMGLHRCRQRNGVRHLCLA